MTVKSVRILAQKGKLSVEQTIVPGELNVVIKRWYVPYSMVRLRTDVFVEIIIGYIFKLFLPKLDPEFDPNLEPLLRM